MSPEEGRMREAEEHHLGIWAAWAEQLVGAVNCRDKECVRRSVKKNELFWNIC